MGYEFSMILSFSSILLNSITNSEVFSLGLFLETKNNVSTKLKNIQILCVLFILT